MTSFNAAGAHNESDSAWPPLDLDSGQRNIRLLTLDSVDHSLGDAGPESSNTFGIGCSLSVVPLDSAPPFYALSYCWGNEVEEQEIRCNGYPLKVRPNLYNALSHLQDLGYTSLWIDAICIHQSDIVEKSHQVNLMGEIYAASQSTMVWLGKHVGSQDQAAELVRILSTAYSKHLEIFKKCRKLGLFLTSKQLVETGLQHWLEEEESVSEPLFRLFSRPWFSRAWVVQECILAKDVLFVYGKHIMHWKRLYDAHNAVTRIRDWDKRYGHLPEDHRVNNVCGDRFLFQRGEIDMFKSFMSHRSTACSNKADKIFCMLGIFAKSVKGDSYTLCSKPDYELPLEQVFLNFALDLLQTTNNLDILGILRPIDGIQKSFPSWVPDFSTTQQDLVFYWESLTWRTCASGSSVSSVRFQSPSIGLSVQVIDEIVATSECILRCYSAEARKEDLIKNRNAWTEIKDVCQSRLKTCPREGTYVNGQSNERAFWQVMYLRADDDDSLPGAQDYWAPYLEAIMSFPEILLEASAYNEVLAKLHMEKLRAGYSTLSLGYISYQWALENGMRMARTRRGYYCQVPWQTEVGDSIVLCEGGRTPFATRQKAGLDEPRYQMLGGCWVHGLMRGEAWDPEKTEQWWFD